MMLFENVSNLAKDTCPAIDDDFLLHPNAKRRPPFDAASPVFVRQNPRQCLCYAFSCTELQRCQPPYKPLSANSDSCLPAVNTAGEIIA